MMVRSRIVRIGKRIRDFSSKSEDKSKKKGPSMTLFTGRGDVANRYRHLYKEFQNVSSVREREIEFDTRDVYDHVEECRALGIKEIPTVLYRHGGEEHILEGASSKCLTDTLSSLGVKFDETNPMAVRTLGDLLAERTEIVHIEDESDELNDDVVEVESAKDPVLLACLESVLSEAEEMELLWKNEQRRLRQKEDEDRRRRRRRRKESSIEKTHHTNTVKTKKESVISSDVMELLNLLKDPENEKNKESHPNDKSRGVMKRRKQRKRQPDKVYSTTGKKSHTRRNESANRGQERTMTTSNGFDTTKKRQKKKRSSRRPASKLPLEPLSVKKYLSNSASCYSTRSGHSDDAACEASKKLT